MPWRAKAPWTGTATATPEREAAVRERGRAGPPDARERERAEAEEGRRQERAGRVVDAERAGIPLGRLAPGDRGGRDGVRRERPRPDEELRAARSSRHRPASAPASRNATSAAAKASRASTAIGSHVVRRMRLVALALLVAGAAALGASAATTAPPDHAALALNVLPPGEGMSPPDLTSQIDLYDGLTPKQGNVTASDLTRYYKRETLGLGGAKAVRTEHPEKGVTIYRDAYDVPHIYGQSRAATEFGAGWATAEDRGLDLQLLRGPARIAALDVPGYNAFSLALSGAPVRAERADGGVPRRAGAARVEDEGRAASSSPTSTRTCAASTRTSRSRAASSRRSRATTSSRSARSSAPCSARAAATRPRARSSSPGCSSGSAPRRGSRCGTTCASRRTRRRR